MSSRPRIVVLKQSRAQGRCLEPLQERAEILEANDPGEALQLLRQADAEGAVIGESPLDLGRILGALSTGVAIVGHDLRVIWHNKALSELCGQAELVEHDIYQALGCEHVEGPEFCPFNDCLRGIQHSRTRLRLRSKRHVEVRVQQLGDADRDVRLLCQVRDVTLEVKQREKLNAIHRAGLELSYLTPAELAQMSTAERIDLLKANIIQYSRSILDFGNLEIRLIEPGTNRLTVLLSEGMIETSEQRELLVSTEDNGVTGFVAATGTSYLCRDVRSDSLYLPGAADAQSSLTVPVVYQERIIGTFNVESTDPHHFSDSDREFLEVFARQIAVALHTLELLKAEKNFGGSASAEAIVHRVGIPADEILADAIRMLDHLQDPVQSQDAARETVARLLRNARAIKRSIQKVRSKYVPDLSTALPEQTSLLAGRRVLLADDDPDIRREAHSLLGKVGCELDTARNGAEAASLAATIDYDVVMGDIRLPDMTGYDFFVRIRQLRPTTPIVLMTGFGYDPSHSLVKARQEGLRVVLYKPFRLDRLCEAVEDALQLRETHSGSPRPHSIPRKQSIL